MSQNTVPVHTRPSFPQVIARIDQMLAEMQLAQFSFCAYESPESRPGAANSEPCGDLATVHHLASDLPYCSKHFRKLELELALEEFLCVLP